MPAAIANKTLFISGACRGIGLAIALRAARDGATVALIGAWDGADAKRMNQLPTGIPTAAPEDRDPSGRAAVRQ